VGEARGSGGAGALALREGPPGHSAAAAGGAGGAPPGGRARMWRRWTHLGAVGRCIQGVRQYVGAPGARGPQQAFWWWR